MEEELPEKGALKCSDEKEDEPKARMGDRR